MVGRLDELGDGSPCCLLSEGFRFDELEAAMVRDVEVLPVFRVDSSDVGTG